MNISFRGLDVEGTAEYEAPTGPTYACGGTPGSLDVEVHSIILEDAEEFSSYGLLEDLSAGVEEMVAAYHRITGKLLPRVERMALNVWEEDMLEELSELAESER